MGRLEERLQTATDALGAFEKSLDIAGTPTEQERGYAILSFALALETVWKAARAVLTDVTGRERPELGGPKSIVRECRVAGLLSDEDAELAMEALDDRNRLIHTYRETIAAKLHANLPGYRGLLRRWLKALEHAVREA